MPDTTVKYIHSAMAGAPALTGQAGSLIGLLDACLVNGFGTGNVDSIVVAGGIATVTRSAGHPFEVDSVALIAGATVSGGTINGEQRVLAVTTTTYTFDATGIANQTATGAITHKVAPLGWAKQFSGANLAAYKPSDVTATGCLLRVDDTGTNNARVVGYESMSDVNTGVGLFPAAAQQAGGLYWGKSASSDAVARNWVLIGDGKLFYLSVAWGQGGYTSYSLTGVFGDVAPTKSGDPYGCLMHGLVTGSTGSVAGSNVSEYDLSTGLSNSTVGTYFARSYTGIGSSVVANRGFPQFLTGPTDRSGAINNGQISYPNYPDGGLYVVPHYLVEYAPKVLRGVSPGFYCIPQGVGASVFQNRDRVVGVTGMGGKALRVLNSSIGCFAFDVTGPWR